MSIRDATRYATAGMIAAVAVASIALAVSADFHDRFQSTHLQDVADTYAQIDRNVVSATNGEGLFLRLVHIPPSLNEKVICYYLRIVYVLYPRRVLAGETFVPIFTADQLRAASFEPDTAWLLRNHIRTEITFTYDRSNGEVVVTVGRIAPPPLGAR